MARRVYFAFHYKDVEDFRANVVRNSWVTQDREAAGFYDASVWEENERQGDLALKRLINGGLRNTSVTAVLIGTLTYSRRWVRFELVKSFERGNGIFGIHINTIPDKYQQTKPRGSNPLDFLYFRVNNEAGLIYVWEWKGNIEKWKPHPDVPTVRLSDVSYDFRFVKEGPFSKIFPTYDWVTGQGYHNLDSWVEAAAIAAGK